MPGQFPPSPSTGTAPRLNVNSSGHQRNSSSTSSIVVAPEGGRKRRVWIKRPQNTATTVYVEDGDIIDDLKGFIIERYPTSLARCTDPADLSVKYVKGPHDEITFQPDQVVFRILDQHFPHGNMSINDAFIVESMATNAVNDTPIIPPPERKHKSMDESPFNFKSSTLSVEKGISDGHTKNLSTNTNNINSSSGTATATNNNDTTKEKEDSSAAAAATSASRSNSTTPASAAPSTASTTSTSSTYRPSLSSPGSSSYKTNSPNNGVLLLPRQFQLPKTSDPMGHQKTETKEEEKSPEKSSEKQLPSTAEKQSVDATTTSETSGKPQKSDTATAATNGTKKQQQNDDNNNNNNTSKNSKTKLTKPFNIPVLEGVVPQINVLIVEDNVINQKILEAFMRRKKIRSAVAKNGKEAVEKWRQGGFHLVLMDIQLPVMSGLEATKEIRRLEHDNRIGVFSSSDKVKAVKPEDALDIKLFRSPVIIVALTASSLLADKSEALAAGCNDFLTKPVNLTWLEQKTIEWGCMQALIDFEGWKYWIGREDNASKNNNNTSTNGSNTTATSTRAAMPSSRSRSRSRGRRRSGSGEKPSFKSLTGLTPLKTASPQGRSPKPSHVKSPEQKPPSSK